MPPQEDVISFFAIAQANLQTVPALVSQVQETKSPVCSHLRATLYTDTLGNEYRVGCSGSVEETYGNLVLWYLSQYRTFDFIRFCKPSNERSLKTLPSWILDWRDWASLEATVYAQNDAESRIPLYKINVSMTPFRKSLQLVKVLQALTLSGFCHFEDYRRA